jgi:hypothetical protein
MTMNPPPDRRKNPSRKKAAGIVYLVELDKVAGRWNVMRDGVAIGAFARDKSTAVGQAYHAASREHSETTLPVAVWSVQDGKRKKEWP